MRVSATDFYAAVTGKTKFATDTAVRACKRWGVAVESSGVEGRRQHYRLDADDALVAKCKALWDAENVIKPEHTTIADRLRALEQGYNDLRQGYAQLDQRVAALWDKRAK